MGHLVGSPKLAHWVQLLSFGFGKILKVFNLSTRLII